MMIELVVAHGWLNMTISIIQKKKVHLKSSSQEMLQKPRYLLLNISSQQKLQKTQYRRLLPHVLLKFLLL